MEEGQHSWYSRASPLVQFVLTILFSPSSLRHFALLAIALFNYVHPLSAYNYQSELSLYSDHNKALYNHSFSNFSKTTLENCLAHCLKDCLCLSFQICKNNDDPQCQLCSSNKYLKPFVIEAKWRLRELQFRKPRRQRGKSSSAGNVPLPYIAKCTDHVKLIYDVNYRVSKSRYGSLLILN